MSSVERLQEAVVTLVVKRHALPKRDAGRDKLESNRLELARRQRQLSDASKLVRGWSLIRADADARPGLSRDHLREDEVRRQAESERPGGTDRDHSVGGHALDHANRQAIRTEVFQEAER